MFLTGLFCFVSIFGAEIRKHRVECSFCFNHTVFTLSRVWQFPLPLPSRWPARWGRSITLALPLCISNSAQTKHRTNDLKTKKEKVKERQPQPLLPWTQVQMHHELLFRTCLICVRARWFDVQSRHRSRKVRRMIWTSTIFTSVSLLNLSCLQIPAHLSYHKYLSSFIY
jgi:hypothetical protein